MPPASPAGSPAPDDALRPTSPAEVAEAVRAAYAARTPLRVTGAGTWLDAGRPVPARRTLSVAALAGVLEYVPGDLTLTALAGTPLAELEAVTAAEGQWVPLDPFGAPDATVGATIATASAGPLAASVGTPRDVVLGLEAVLGQGDVVRAGGRVVKNVAGFDLVRLLTGAWGTLGVLTTVTLRLRALPEADVTVALPAPDDGRHVGELLESLASRPVAPAALELVDGALAGQLGLERRPLLLVRLMGSGVTVRAQRDTLATIGDVIEVPGTLWAGLRASDPPGAPAIRWSAGRRALPRLWEAAREAAEAMPGTHTHASVSRGVVRQVAGAVDDEEELCAHWSAVREALSGTTVTTVAERLPAALWPALAPSRVTDRLSLGVRQAFDPEHLLNPGILGEPAPPPVPHGRPAPHDVSDVRPA